MSDYGTQPAEICRLSVVEARLHEICSRFDVYQDGILRRGALEHYYKSLRDEWFKIGDAAAISKAKADEFIALLEEHAEQMTPKKRDSGAQPES